MLMRHMTQQGKAVSVVPKTVEEFAKLPPGKAHEVIVRGVPVRRLVSFVSSWGLSQTEASKVLAVGVRTYQRMIKTPNSALDTASGSRLYRAASIMQKANEVLGSAEEARKTFFVIIGFGSSSNRSTSKG